MKKVFSIAVAVFFILVGVLGLLSSLTTFSIDWRFLGAAIPLFIGLFFQVQYFTEKKEPGLLVPGGTLTVIGILVLLDFFFTDSVSEYIWPFYILAPAVGLFQFYWFGKRDRALLIPVTVLSVVCVVFLLVTLYQIPPFSYILPILLLVIGTFMLYTYFRKGEKTVKKPIAGLFFTLLFCLAAGILYAGGPEGILSEAIRGFTGDHVVGEPIVAGEVVIIPIFSADFSFGEISGGPDGEVWGSGASGKLNFLPYAIAIVDQKGVRVLPVSNKKTFFEQVVEALPKLMPIVQQVIGYFSLNSGSAALEMPKTGSEQIIDVETLQPTDRVAELYHRVQLGLPPEDYQEILAEARELLPEDPGNAKLHSVNAYATMMMIQKAGPLQQIRMALEAQKEIDTALSLDPNDILGLISQGWMNLHNPMGRIDLAEAAFEKVLSIDPEHLEALMGLTMVYEKMGRSEKVKEWAEKGLALDPENEYFLNLIH